MNEARAACGGDEWRAMMRSIVPSTIGHVDLGHDVLEVGPGYGAATDVVCEIVSRLTAVEVDIELVDLLRDRFAGRSHVEIIHGDATSLPFADERFSGAICFTMFHE